MTLGTAGYNPPLSCFIIFDCDAFFFVKNKHGAPPSYSSVTEAEAEVTPKPEKLFTTSNSLFPFIDEILETFGREGGFDRLVDFLTHFPDIQQVAKFLQTFANSISFLAVRALIRKVI